jgi:hypothetical protein
MAKGVYINIKKLSLYEDNEILFYINRIDNILVLKYILRNTQEARTQNASKKDTDTQGIDTQDSKDDSKKASFIIIKTAPKTIYIEAKWYKIIIYANSETI